MPPEPSDQCELDFSPDGESAGYLRWQQERQQALRSLAEKLGLPLDRPVEVWLAGGIRLRGVLKLHRPDLFVAGRRDFEIELEIDGVAFRAKEIESCVRRD